MKSLKDVKVGETATVVKLHGEGATKRRTEGWYCNSGRSKGCYRG